MQIVLLGNPVCSFDLKHERAVSTGSALRFDVAEAVCYEANPELLPPLLAAAPHAELLLLGQKASDAASNPAPALIGTAAVDLIAMQTDMLDASIPLSARLVVGAARNPAVTCVWRRSSAATQGGGFKSGEPMRAARC